MNFGKNITIRRLFENERPAALDLAWRVFSEYESPDYAAEGTALRCVTGKLLWKVWNTQKAEITWKRKYTAIVNGEISI